MCSRKVAEALYLSAVIPINFGSIAIGSYKRNMCNGKVTEALCLSIASLSIFGAAAIPSNVGVTIIWSFRRKEKTEATKSLR